MDKTKSKLAAFFDEDEEDSSSFPPKKVDEHKLSQYTQGTSRKSKREKEKEAAELKRKEEEEHAARAYAEFLETFEGGGEDSKQKGFVKSAADSGSIYHLSATNSSAAPSRSRPLTMPPSPPPVAAKPKGKRAMDSFLEEIKRDQAEREAKYSRHAAHGRSVTAMAAYEGQSGSKDRGDPETTNIFVANLPTHVTEQSLGNFFARIGPVASVKIMWPRGDVSLGPGSDMTASRRNKSSGLSGFVSFMKRRDAEAALRELDGFDWGGSVLRVGWSKAVPVGSKALYTAPKARSRSRSISGGNDYNSRSPSPSRSREHYQSARLSSRSRSWSRSPKRSRSPRQRTRRRSYSRSRRYSYSRSRSPHRRRPSPDEKKSIGDDDVTDEFIRMVAAEVKSRGLDFEKTLKEREKNNSKYLFLVDNRHRRHYFYRSIVQNERTAQPEFDEEGYNSVYSTDSAEESERERVRKHHLGRLARRRFEAMLRGLSGRRGELARCMAFSLEHAEAASEVADIIISSLLIAETPVPRKVARLHLICDILHNSAAPLPMAWKFRQEFQSRLGLVFDHLSTIYHSFPGRITAETFKKQILSVVEIWEDWIVFSPDYTLELRSRLDGTIAEDEKSEDETGLIEVQESATDYSSRFKASSFKPADPSGEQVVEEAGEEQGLDDGGDIDGEPVDDVDGEPIEDLDGEPIQDDLDGEPLAMDDEDVDGEPMDEDMDGVPMS